MTVASVSVRQTVWSMTNGHCFYCGRKLEEQFHIDHVVPKARGGVDHIANYVPACRECNLSKRARLIHEWEPSPKMPFGMPVGVSGDSLARASAIDAENEILALRQRVRKLRDELIATARREEEWKKSADHWHRSAKWGIDMIELCQEQIERLQADLSRCCDSCQELQNRLHRRWWRRWL